MRVVTVLRSGGEFKPEHVQALHSQIDHWLLGVDGFCISDTAVTGIACDRLIHDWPGWWSKMELFRPDIEGDLLYFDLDTVIVGGLEDLASVNRLTLMRDVYRPDGLQSSVMFLPEADRRLVWAEWQKSPLMHMRRHRRGGDQGFLETLWLDKADRWQDVLPGQVVSYKADIRKKGDVLPPNARVIAFHGRPRPWALPPLHPLYRAAGY